jgi:hypothetical protein
MCAFEGCERDHAADRAAREIAGTYSCAHCNKWYCVHDPEFDYFRRFGETHWLVKAGLVKAGDRMMGQVEAHGRPVRETYGWFARCVDEEACARRRENSHAGVHPEQLVLEAA